MNDKSILRSFAALSMLLAGCSNGTGPSLPSKLFVTNTTCAAGPCATFEVLVFPENQPTTPAGSWSLDLGAVAGPSACLTIPGSATFTIADAASGEKTVVRWSSTQRASIGLVTAGQTRFQSSPSTGAFIPARAAAWSVALPGSAMPVPGGACK